MSAVIHSSRSLAPRSVTARVHPIALAAVASLVAAVLALAAHVAFGVGETPLVIGTLLVTSVAGWANVSSPRTRRHDRS